MSDKVLFAFEFSFCLELQFNYGEQTAFGHKELPFAIEIDP